MYYKKHRNVMAHHGGATAHISKRGGLNRVAALPSASVMPNCPNGVFACHLIRS